MKLFFPSFLDPVDIASSVYLLQEAQVLARVAELRRQGLWTASRLPMIEMPSRNKTQWDYLLEEMRWMAADFRQERTFKRHAARKVL